ncbi:MAG: hypothetical protein ACM3KH_00190 [Thiobacillus sp.]
MVNLEIMGLSVPLPDIEPGGIPGSMMDNNPNNPRVLLMSCNDDDSGGVVYSANPEDSFYMFDRTTRGIHTADGIEGLDIEARIVRGGYYERHILTKRGMGRLVLAHYVRVLN